LERDVLHKQLRRIKTNLTALTPVDRCLQALEEGAGIAATRQSLEHTRDTLRNDVLKPLGSIMVDTTLE